MTEENLSQQAVSMTTYWQLYQMQFYLERMQANINLINSVPNAKLITVIGGNLFQIASQYYGDASQWPLIAQANQLTDPMLVGINSLLVPPLNNQDTGGILNAGNSN
jgi:hypothetical protein